MTAPFKFLNSLNLSVRLNLIIVVVASLVMLTMSAILNISLTVLTERMGQQRVLEETEVLRSHLAEVEQQLLAEAKVVANTSELIEAVARRDLDRVTTQLLIGAAPFAFDEIDVVDANHMKLELKVNSEETNLAGQEELLSLALLGIQKTMLTLDPQAGLKLRLSAALPLKDRTGTIVGVLLVSRIVDDDFLAGLNFSREKVHLVLFYAGEPIAQQINHLGQPETSPASNNLPGGENNLAVKLQAIYPNLANEHMLKQASGGETVVADDFIYDALDQHVYTVAYLPLSVKEHPEAVIAVLADLSELTIFQSEMTRLLTGLSAVLGLAAVGSMALFSRKSIAIPLRQLSAAAKRMTAGDLTARVGYLESGSEIGLLATSFDQMADQLQQTLVNLEQRVAERTAELETSNRQLSWVIDERKQAELALRESEARFRRVVNSISDHIYMTEFSPAGKPINGYISPNVIDLTGYPAEKLLADWSFWPTVIIHPDDQPLAAEQAQRLFRGQDSQVEYRLVRADGEIIWVRDSGRVETDPVSQHFVVYGVVSDVTARKQAEETLTQAHDQAQEASRLKTQLLANVSHDLRTPLNAILGYTEMLLEGIYGPISDHQRGAVAEIIDSTGQLLNFINNLLSQAQIESGKVLLKTTPFSPDDLLETVNSINILAQAKNVNLVFNLAAGLPDQLYGDFYWLRKILLNLVDNAIKFTEPGGSVQIYIFQPDETRWALQVADTGCGIPVEAQNYIFESFRQVDGTSTRLHGGSGVGLAIVNQLTMLMGGQIILDSKVGQGSTFTVYLPLLSTQELSL